MKRGDAASTKLVSLREFEDFVRRVVAVPKKEIDKRLAQQQRKRKKGRSAPAR